MCLVLADFHVNALAERAVTCNEKMSVTQVERACARKGGSCIFVPNNVFPLYTQYNFDHTLREISTCSTTTHRPCISYFHVPVHCFCPLLSRCSFGD